MCMFNVESQSPRCGLFAIARLSKDTYECKICKDWCDIVGFLGTDFRLPQLHKLDFELPRTRQECLRFASRAHVLLCGCGESGREREVAPHVTCSLSLCLFVAVTSRSRGEQTTGGGKCPTVRGKYALKRRWSTMLCDVRGGGGSHFWQCILGLRFLTDHDVAGGTSHTRHCKAEPHAENLYGGPSETPQDMRVRARGSQGWTALGSLPHRERGREREGDYTRRKKKKP